MMKPANSLNCSMKGVLPPELRIKNPQKSITRKFFKPVSHFRNHSLIYFDPLNALLREANDR